MVIISKAFQSSIYHYSRGGRSKELLTSFRTGAYPTSMVRKMLSLPYLKTNAKANR